MLKNRLSNINDDLFREYMGFSARHRDIIKFHYMLQKLIIFDFVIPILRESRTDRILEIGCGQGVHSCLLSNYGSVCATELKAPGNFVGAVQQVDEHRKVVFEELSKNSIAFSYNDGRRLPYAENSFDVVFHNSVIEHVPDPVAFNREIGRVLKPNGLNLCITGTSVLCLFRLIKDYALKAPLHFLVALYREAVTSKRFRRINDKFRGLLPEVMEGGHTEGCSGLEMRPLYAKLFNFISNPEYNRILLEDIAAAHRISVEELLGCIAAHFDRSFLNRILFYMTPRTHGQHYKNVFDEMKQWRIDNWVAVFTNAGFAVDDIIPYRYHHLLEISPSYRVDTLVYFYFTALIGALSRHAWVKPWLASEFILVSRKR